MDHTSLILEEVLIRNSQLILHAEVLSCEEQGRVNGQSSHEDSIEGSTNCGRNTHRLQFLNHMGAW